MFLITCQFNQFQMDYSIKNLKERYLDFARSITASLRHSLQSIKTRLHKEIGEDIAKKIGESAAFVVLEQNMSEYVHNTIDAAISHSLNLQNQEIRIQIPKTIHQKNTVKIRYTDTAGGFSLKFMEGKSLIDYFYDKLWEKRISVETDKKFESGFTFLGGFGFALSQTCRFLKKNNGALKLKNKESGAELIFISPARPENRKPSFNNFRNMDNSDEVADINSACHPLKKLSLSIPSRKIQLSHLVPTPENASSTDSIITPLGSPFGFFRQSPKELEDSLAQQPLQKIEIALK